MALHVSLQAHFPPSTAPATRAQSHEWAGPWALGISAWRPCSRGCAPVMGRVHRRSDPQVGVSSCHTCPPQGLGLPVLKTVCPPRPVGAHLTPSRGAHRAGAGLALCPPRPVGAHLPPCHRCVRDTRAWGGGQGRPRGLCSPFSCQRHCPYGSGASQRWGQAAPGAQICWALGKSRQRGGGCPCHWPVTQRALDVQEELSPRGLDELGRTRSSHSGVWGFGGEVPLPVAQWRRFTK